MTTYSIFWKAPGSLEWEEIDTAEDENERDFLIREYRIAYGNEGDLRTQRTNHNYV